MNVVGFVFGWLMIFACVFSLSIHKTSLAKSADRSEKSNLAASRKILNSYESLLYRREKGKPIKNSREPKTMCAAASKKTRAPLNPPCARLNIWPLVQDGKEMHPALYDLAAKLLRFFYADPLLNEARLEYRLLDAMLDSARLAQKQRPAMQIPLEKLPLSTASFQNLYYQMLKGTKQDSRGFPSLLDYLSCECRQSKICLKHASFPMISCLFGPSTACPIYRAIHEDKTHLSEEFLQNICTSSGAPGIERNILEFLELNQLAHPPSQQKTIEETSKGISLKKRVFLSRG